MDLNRFLEEGQWGLSGPGVKSFGDITANWEGYKFWSELTEGENPYFHCENNQFILSRKFNWMNYVSAAWDEGINCSERLPEIEFSVQNVIKEKKLSGCPIKQEFCKALVDRYQSISSKLLHPVCLKGKGNK